MKSINVIGYATEDIHIHSRITHTHDKTNIGQTIYYFTDYIIKIRSEPSLHFLVLQKGPIFYLNR